MNNPYGIEALWSEGGIVIRGVALILLLMSLTSWCIILISAWKQLRIRRYTRQVNDFWHAGSLDEGLRLLGAAQHTTGAIGMFRNLAEQGVQSVAHHASHSKDLHGKLPLAEWLSSSLSATIDESSEQLQRGLSVLASVGSTAPFVGLFGTVWGIYNALVAIGISGQASIDKVAGPVGEALIMTAFGLAVAIPAVLGYNALNRGNRNILARLNRFAHQLHAFLLIGSWQEQTAENAPESRTVVTPMRGRTESRPEPAGV